MSAAKLTPSEVVDALERDRHLFATLLPGIPVAQREWRPAPDRWTVHEVACHLLDEETDDFRTRVRSVLSDPEAPLPPIDPPGWVTERRYAERDYTAVVEEFLAERDASVAWLRSLESPRWENAYEHPRWGAQSARLFLLNWWAHDLLHLRQIHRLGFEYLESHGGETLAYAGEW